MPLVLPDASGHDFRSTGIAVLAAASARRQQILPLRVLLLDLDAPAAAPGETATTLLALLSNTPLQVEPVFAGADRATWPTAPVDGLVAWAAQSAAVPDQWPTAGASLLFGEAARVDLERRHGLRAEQLTRPLAEIVPQRIADTGSPLTAGQEPQVEVPVLRTWRLAAEDIAARPGLEVLAGAPRSGAHLVHEPAIRRLYVLNPLTITPLGFARARRLLAPGAADAPLADTPLPSHAWRTHAHLLAGAWLNAAVYQPASLAGWLGQTPEPRSDSRSSP